ncbi:MAG: hypothetical protein M1823_000955 [Watsoniomyces obsoletus]|nr:MAG: hypothetical protein M1823_000955 [Watsoniomyces obsoletus]
MRCIISSTTLLLSLLAVSIEAAPAPAPVPVSVQSNKGKTSFIVKRYENPRFVRRGDEAVRQAFGKFGWDLPHVAPKQTGKVDTVDDTGSKDIKIAAADSAPPAETQFLVPMMVGGQAMTLNLDTGSSDLWVFSSKLPPSSIRGQSVFDPAKSPSFKLLEGQKFSIKYGDQSSASGIVGIDTVNIGGAEVKEQAVELATKVSGHFIEDLNSDGLVGLGFSVSNQVRPTKQKTFFDNIMPSLEQPVFTAVLRRADNGSYEFGRIDSSKFIGQLNHVPIDPSKGWWQFDSPGVTVGDKVFRTKGATSIADTGTSILLMRNDVVEAYYSQVPGSRNDAKQGGFVYPCSVDLPDFGIMITENYTATIEGKLMTFNDMGDLCFGALQSNEGQPVQILGDTLFNSQFVVFDGGEKRLSFAPHS